jgi:hypothetical protein
MARIYRGAGSNYTPSQAEKDLLRRFEEPESPVVILSELDKAYEEIA